MLLLVGAMAVACSDPASNNGSQQYPTGNNNMFASGSTSGGTAGAGGAGGGEGGTASQGGRGGGCEGGGCGVGGGGSAGGADVDGGIDKDGGTPEPAGGGGPGIGGSGGGSIGIGGGSTLAPGPCPTFVAAFETNHLVPTGPTDAFVNAYVAELDDAPAGPFAIQLLGVDLPFEDDYGAMLSGGESIDGYFIAATEVPGAEAPVAITDDGEITVAYAEAVFHLAFTTIENTAGDIEISGFELEGALTDECKTMTATVALYVPASAANSMLGDSQLGALLGEPNGTDGGWKIDLSGVLNQASVQ